MRKVRNLAVAVLILAAVTGSAREARAQTLWTGALGVGAGTLSGGYITLSIVVARAQMGHYLHEARDILDWKSLPVLIGGSVGGALGVWAPDRLGTGAVYGAAGTLAGGTAGFIVGALVSNRPEGRWAGGAIGAGLGMAIGTTLGVFVPNPALDPTGKSSKAVVPIEIRIPL